mmetsp:Transcript_3989/g.5444  ORF Transcript_3989/g.5444 Transcript_3989/m.5444 type:complete len:107 (-) Transcript_3989:427-747(-)
MFISMNAHSIAETAGWYVNAIVTVGGDAVPYSECMRFVATGIIEILDGMMNGQGMGPCEEEGESQTHEGKGDEGEGCENETTSAAVFNEVDADDDSGDLGQCGESR